MDALFTELALTTVAGSYATMADDCADFARTNVALGTPYENRKDTDCNST